MNRTVGQNEVTPLDLAQFEGHTPGLWRYGEHSRHIYAVGSGHHIATINPATPYSRTDDRDDNGRLLAAAPALLAECKRLRALLRSLEDDARSHGARV